MQRGARLPEAQSRKPISRGYEKLASEELCGNSVGYHVSSIASRLGKQNTASHIAKTCWYFKSGHNGLLYNFLRTDRIGVVGPNDGKTTTPMKLITGVTAGQQREPEIGDTVRIDYFSQENEALIPT